MGLVSCTAVSGDDSTDDSVKVKINDNVFDVKLENNSATQEFIKELKKGNVTVNASEYGGFEKVGNLGFSLPTSDKNIQLDYVLSLTTQKFFMELYKIRQNR